MKKILSLLLVGIMIISLAACGGGAPKGEKLNMVAEAKGMEEGTVYSADIYYEPTETVEVSSSYANRQEIKDKEQNIALEFRLANDTTFGNNKKTHSSKNGYTEFKVGDYDAYAYHFSNTMYKIYVLLDGSAESAKQAQYMDITVAPYDKGSDTTGEQVYEMEYVKNVINSITYNGLVAPGAETEAE